MRTFTIASTILSSALLANAQLAYDVATQSLKCAKPNAVYCIGDSMAQSLIAHCDSAGIATVSCCTGELSSLPPLGLKPTALCFQSTTITGDASCALNGTIYPPGGPAALPVPVKPVAPIPAVINIADTPPENCGCHNSTYPLGPAGPTGPIVPPVTKPSGTPVSPIIPPVISSAPPAYGYPTGAYGTGAPHSTAKSTISSFSYSMPKPTPTPSKSSTPASPVATGAAEKRAIPVMAMGALGAVAFFL